MRLIRIKNPLSKKDLAFQEEDVPKYFSLYYYALFVVIVSYHISDMFEYRAKTSMLILSVLIPSIVNSKFLISKSKKIELDTKWDAEIYTSLPALLVIYSALIGIEVLADAYSMYWG
jgi:hypothetical protein